MAFEGGPLPIIENPSNYGQEAETQRLIQQAKQYNPASALGITAGDQPSKRAIVGPTTKQALAPVISAPQKIESPVSQPQVQPDLSATKGFGPKSGLEGNIKDNIQSLAQHPAAGPEVQHYARSATNI